ncbi:MAG TPA: RsmE family RNA methyltransferase [Opitutus sp.]|nr:RsmE family RNA methyltransferase [Opitutus sp.]
MNLILFEPGETAASLPREDRRAVHLVKVLRRQVGDTFDAGLVDGPRGKGTIAAIGERALTLRFDWAGEPPPLDPITLIVGLPRPQTARDILRDATTLGVSAMHFVATDKADPNYAQATLWQRGEWRRHLIAGAEQAFSTRIPAVSHGRPLAAVLAEQPAAIRLALDNYESPSLLSHCPALHDHRVVLAVGPERGWSAAERDVLREQNFSLAHLGPRVLRTETAVVAALAIVKAKLGRA